MAASFASKRGRLFQIIRSLPFALGGTGNPLGSISNGGHGFGCAKGS